MTRFAIFGDTHGELTALEAVLEDLRAQIVDEVIVAGDLVQGGPSPVAVLDRITAEGWPSVRGNSDDAQLQVADGSAPEGLPETFYQRARWTNERLGKERLDLLRALPLAIERELPDGVRLLVLHATPWSNEAVVLPDAPEEEASRVVREARADVVAHGHIHTAHQRRLPEGVLLCVGAVGGSNDTDARPAYSILEFIDGSLFVEVRRVEVNLEKWVAERESVGWKVNEGDTKRWTEGGPFPVRSKPGERVKV